MSLFHFLPAAYGTPQAAALQHLPPTWTVYYLESEMAISFFSALKYGYENDVKNPICDYFDLLNLRIQILTEWLPEMGFQLRNAPELAVYHWMPKAERNVQIWMPIEKVL